MAFLIIHMILCGLYFYETKIRARVHAETFDPSLREKQKLREFRKRRTVAVLMKLNIALEECARTARIQ